MKLMAIDPGTTHSAWVTVDTEQRSVLESGYEDNETILAMLEADRYSMEPYDRIAIEMVACYGMAVGKDVFKTVFWIGRFWQEADMEPRMLVYRKDVKLHLCGSTRAKDANIRQALIDKWGPIGTKKNQGPLFGISKHKWAALAVADYAIENWRAGA